MSNRVTLSAIWIGSGYSLTVLMFLVVLLYRRKMQPIRFRGPYLLCASGLGGSIIVVWLFTYLIRLNNKWIDSHVFCTMGEYIVWVVYPLFILPYMLRAYRIWHIFSPSRVYKLADSNRYNELVLTEGVLLRVLMFFLCLLLGTMYIRDYTAWHFNILGYGCTPQDVVFWLVVHIFEMVVMVYALTRLRKVRDDYGVTVELKLACCVWVIATLLQFGFGIKQPKSLLHDMFGGPVWPDSTYETVSAVLIICRNAIIFGISVIVPVFQSFAAPFVPLWSNCDALISLDALLKDIVCIQYFRNFLTQKDRVENILCWVEIELYRDLNEKDELATQAQRIFDKYVSDNAELEVDLPTQVKKRLIESMHSRGATRDVFHEVQHHLYLHMNKDFPKFLASDICTECLQDLEQEERLRIVLEESNMI